MFQVLSPKSITYLFFNKLTNNFNLQLSTPDASGPLSTLFNRQPTTEKYSAQTILFPLSSLHSFQPPTDN